MVRIRLRRMGAKKNALYRVVVARQQNARDGRFIEIVGTYNPHNDDVKLVNDRIAHWLSVGAQPSDAVARMLRNVGLLDSANKPVAQAAIDQAAIDPAAESSESQAVAA
ncbi:MAG: 30S ribosomal protein S16 [Litorilinea sp.]